jgi:hypothetical protein
MQLVGIALVFILRPPLTMLPEALSFDTTEGFTVTNRTQQNVFLQTSSTGFETIQAGRTSTAHTAYRSYQLRVNNDTNSGIYLTIVIDVADGSVKVEPGARRGRFVVTSNFL